MQSIRREGQGDDGLLDAAGNVWEWCLNPYDAPDDPGATAGGNRSLRGSSWNGLPANARAANRVRFNPVDRDDSVGFRLVCACPIDSEH